MASAASTSTLDIDKASDVASRRTGYERLFPKQREAVEAFISGRDVFVCLPAGGYIRKELLLWLPQRLLKWSVQEGFHVKGTILLIAHVQH